MRSVADLPPPQVNEIYAGETGAYSLIPSSQPADTEEQRANRVSLAMVTKMVTVTNEQANRNRLACS
jgi:hypothetical protein